VLLVIDEQPDPRTALLGLGPPDQRVPTQPAMNPELVEDLVHTVFARLAPSKYTIYSALGRAVAEARVSTTEAVSVDSDMDTAESVQAGEPAGIPTVGDAVASLASVFRNGASFVVARGHPAWAPNSSGSRQIAHSWLRPRETAGSATPPGPATRLTAESSRHTSLGQTPNATLLKTIRARSQIPAAPNGRCSRPTP
jgi:hypothetical protein